MNSKLQTALEQLQDAKDYFYNNENYSTYQDFSEFCELIEAIQDGNVVEFIQQYKD